MSDYLDLVGKGYLELVSNSKFSSLTGGNVPERIDGSTEEFFIISSIKGVQLKFDENQVLDVIMVRNPKIFEGKLENVIERDDVKTKLGMPTLSQEEKIIPVLGKIGAWDKYVLENNKYIQIIYQVGTTIIDRVDYAKESDF